MPPAWPVCVTDAVPVAQYGLPEYEIVAVGNALIDTVAVEVKSWVQVPSVTLTKVIVWLMVAPVIVTVPNPLPFSVRDDAVPPLIL